tara:strand:- start:26 stop:910 length:885 start_codon:yes stop_codon:yes gene_type:complete
MKYLSSKEVSEILGINISTLKRWTDTGVITCFKTPGGHRKFTINNIRDYYKTQKQAGKNQNLGLENKNHKKIYNLINNQDFVELSRMLADTSLESDDLTVNTIISGAYIKGYKIEDICDEIIEPAIQIVENALIQGYLSHIEIFISRKLITRATERLIQNNLSNGHNNKTALCINFEDNLPDLGIVMSEVVLREYGYNVLNSGSHADLGDIRAIIRKRNIDLILFFLCDMQCCMATVKDNLAKTEDQTNEIVNLARKLGSKVVFGGSGLQFLPSIEKSTDFNFIKFADLKKLIS